MTPDAPSSTGLVTDDAPPAGGPGPDSTGGTPAVPPAEQASEAGRPPERRGADRPGGNSMWLFFFLALLFFQESSMDTCSIGLQFFRGLRGYVVVNRMFAISSLASLPALLPFVLFQRRLVRE